MQHLLPELTGCVLACDCEMHMVCEWDALAGLVFESGRPPARTKKKRQAGASGQVRRVLAAVAALPPTVGAVIPYWSQEAVVAAFRSLYPPHYFENFCFLMVEDLVNQPPFTCFTQWLRSRGLRWDGPLVPMLASPQQRLLARTAEGQQAGALSGKAACPPLLPLPTEQPPLMDLDLQFAADSMAGNYGSLRDLRQGAVRALRELKSRWARVSTRLRHLQPDAIRAATQQRDLGSWAFSWCCCPGAMWPCHWALFGGSRQWGWHHPMAFSRSNRPCPSHWRMSSLTVRRTTQRSELPLSLACVTISSSASEGESREAHPIDSPVCHSAVLGQAAHYR